MQVKLTVGQGQEDFRHENGEISKVLIEAVVLRFLRVMVSSLTRSGREGLENGAGLFC